MSLLYQLNHLFFIFFMRFSPDAHITPKTVMIPFVGLFILWGYICHVAVTFQVVFSAVFPPLLFNSQPTWPQCQPASLLSYLLGKSVLWGSHGTFSGGWKKSSGVWHRYLLPLTRGNSATVTTLYEYATSPHPCLLHPGYFSDLLSHSCHSQSLTLPFGRHFLLTSSHSL